VLLNPNGLLIAEEFSLEQMDMPTVMWFYALESLVKRKAIDLVESIYFKQFKQKELIAKIRESHQTIHVHHVETQSLIVPHTF
jgi:hypothetical protein